MLIAIWTLLLIFRGCIGTSLPEPREKRVDNDPVRAIAMKVDDLLIASEDLGFRINTLNIIMDKHFVSSRNEMKTQIEDLKTQIEDLKTALLEQAVAGGDSDPKADEDCVYSYANLIDVRSDGASESSDGRKICTAKSTPRNKMSQEPPANCAEALRRSGKTQGVHRIRLPDLGSFFVQCWTDPKEGVDAAWTIVQRRLDGSINFQRDWKDYEQGFGNMEGEFFVGLAKLHALTQTALHELWIRLEDFDGEVRHANYTSFAIGDAKQSYELNMVGNYSGNAGDSFKPHAGQKFTTLDVDNDNKPDYNCAVKFTGAWWYKSCHESNLNGQYLKGVYPGNKFGQGIDWLKWHGHTYSLKTVHMAIRPAAK